MKLKFLLIVSIIAFALHSCSKDDGPKEEANNPPSISDKTVSVSEAITPGTTVETLTATDADDDTLTFSITGNPGPFKISTDGVLTLASGKTLDFDVTNSYSITVSVTDGTDSATATITINVTQVVPTNQAPEIADQAFEASEDSEVGVTLYTLKNVSDPDGDPLTFEISVNDNGLFAINDNGEISLAEGQSLDYETTTSHQITVSVSDGTESSTAVITINVTNVNEVPTIDPQGLNFEVSEDATSTDVLGTMNVTDPDGDPLTFEISANDNDLFAINDDGEISLAEGQSLDYETATSHQITVSVNDGTNSTVALVIITVTNVVDTLFEDPDSFIITFKTTQANEEIQVGTDVNLSYDYTIDWGDGTVEQKTTSTPPAHIFTDIGEHTIAIKGTFPRIVMYQNPSQDKLIGIHQWGNIAWSSFQDAFRECANLANYYATDAPDLSNVTNLTAMFNEASSFSFDGSLNHWDLSTITNTRSMFAETAFNGDISDWDVKNVTVMGSMFYKATVFNGDISGWQTDSAVNISWMFRDAENFDQNIGAWNISNVTTMATMLDGSGLSTSNYGDTLIGWASQGGVPNNISLGAAGLEYCGFSAYDAREFLINSRGWTITGDSQCE